MVTVAYRPGLLFQSGAGEIWPRKPPPLSGEQSDKKQKSATSDQRKIIKHLSNLIQFNHQNIIRIISSDQSKSSKEFMKLLQSKGFNTKIIGKASQKKLLKFILPNTNRSLPFDR